MAGMVVQHNMNALNSYNRLNTNIAGLKKSSEKLSSGYRINRAGDDAAGLAISEKMRSQIRGLNQAKRNSQDGISMIQTYEGALQETHSILQRMKELASESANGTYQNEVDRDAIQLEFAQLNDELNQIADTDFNGVVMLNGGEMADGTKAVNGKFSYVANDPRTEAMQWSSSDVNTIDSKGYNGKTAASDSLWANLGLGDDVESVELTFTYNKSNDTWSITDSDSSTALANKANVKVVRGGTKGATTAAGAATTAANNNGGFSLSTSTTKAATGVGADAAITATAGEVANVVLDTTELVDGDTVKLTFTRPPVNNTAPENIAIADGSLVTNIPSTSAAKVTAPTLTVNGGTGAAAYESTNITNAAATAMTKEAADAFNGLNGAKVEITYVDTTANAAVVDAYKVTLADGKSVEIKNAVSGTGSAETGSVVSEDGIKYNFAKDAAGVLTITDAAGKELAKITAAAGDVTGLAADGAAGNETVKTSFTLALDTAVYSEASQPKVSISNPAQTNAVSKSDSNNAATAPLTYTDHMVLQTGARTKDSVDFTFSYDTEGMGDLKSNLNVSSRTDGLGTADLSLATQEDANAAIDKIDNAINKVSMVRATFGATQNRLEHKIENLTATAENLTEAESTIRDTDMASEMMSYTKYNILQQAAQSMLAQANQQPQSILQLLG